VNTSVGFIALGGAIAGALLGTIFAVLVHMDVIGMDQKSVA
jgi:hypothetical protein